MPPAPGTWTGSAGGRLGKAELCRIKCCMIFACLVLGASLLMAGPSCKTVRS
jgi:hypothetical protein